MNQDEIIKQYLEVVNIIPMDKMGLNGKDGQTLYGDVTDWLKDHFNAPSNDIVGLMLVGHYYTQKELDLI